MTTIHRSPASHSSADMQASSSLGDDNDVWNKWELPSLIICSLILQVFLFLAAGQRRCRTSLVLRTLLWLAYLSADFVATFVLGHLALHASEPSYQLMSFWAPFLLVHLGGQDTITAFSKQDNELWTRHLLNLLSQVAVALYVVAKASWPDRWLKSAMVLMFISGCIKYAERTMCLFISNPDTLRWFFMEKLSNMLSEIRAGAVKKQDSKYKEAEVYMEYRLLQMSSYTWDDDFDENVLSGGKTGDWMSMAVLFVDAPPNREQSIIVADSLPALLKDKFDESRADSYRNNAYEFVAAYTASCYYNLYTKYWLQKLTYGAYTEYIPMILCNRPEVRPLVCFFLVIPILLYPLFQLVSTPVALWLYIVAQKGEHQLHTSQPYIYISYILLIGAMALNLSSTTMFLLSKRFPLSAPWSKKQWCEELGQYSMINRHISQDTSSSVMSISETFVWQLSEWGVGLVEVAHTPITEPIKKLIFDKLILHGTRSEWEVSSSRGLLAVKNWKESRGDQESKDTAEALEKTIRNIADLPMSVLIWHLATDICYYYNSGDASTSNNNNQTNDKKTIYKDASRQISNYIMYLVFKCGVMLTPNSQHVHRNARQEIVDLFPGLLYPQQVKEMFVRMLAKRGKGYSASTATEDTAATGDHVQKHVQTAQAFDTDVLPRAYELAQMLIDINDEGEAGRWGLIAKVWCEMLYYAAPRCGGAFHYEHLSTGGEFATHVLVLMRELGPFMPPPGAASLSSVNL